MKQELIVYRRSAPCTDHPIIRSFPDENVEPKGTVANLTEQWMRKPADRKTHKKLAQK